MVGKVLMNWNEISVISEVVGVIAIVTSLLHFAFPIRFATRAATDRSRMARAIGVREIDLTKAIAAYRDFANEKRLYRCVLLSSIPSSRHCNCAKHKLFFFFP